MYYFFNDIINIKKIDLNNIKIDGKSYRNILTFYIGYVTIKDSNDVKINSINPLYLIFNKVNGYFEEINNKIKHQSLLIRVKKKIKKYEELWSKSDI